MQPDTTPTSTPPRVPAPLPGEKCANCGTPLYGRYCYACGQPTHGLVRHFGSVLADVTDSVFNIDERVLKTLLPLYLRPGRLTIDYLAGRRARYVTPFRLVFFLAIVAFFAVQLSVRAGYARVEPLQVTMTPGHSGGFHVAREPEGPAVQTPASGMFANGNFSVNGKVLWNHDTRPLIIGWLPAAGNEWLNDMIGNAQHQIQQMNSGTAAERTAAGHRFMLGAFSAAPTVLFVLLPVFALLLKIFYIFKRRLYMEHLIVAMHSHAFLMLSVLVLVVVGVLRHVLLPHAGWLAVPFGLLKAAVWIWIFVYLWLMQKRVYRQGWFMTTLKYCWIGFFYSILLGIGWAFALLISLASA